jgi:hydrogenase maturation protein HypF
LSVVRLAIELDGLVQGIGYRPFVLGLAMRTGVAGFVLNHGGGVRIEVEGPAGRVAAFRTALVDPSSFRARANVVSEHDMAVRGDEGFRIATSSSSSTSSTSMGEVASDLAPCSDCMAELFDRSNRRFRYPFISCTACGPRMTIIDAVPWDRVRTTLSGFTPCSACAAEYGRVGDRRLHAQTISCPACGPTLQLVSGRGELVDHECVDAVAFIARELAAGAVAAIRGTGGYHLACDATRADAVARVRQLKRRDAKPLAVLVDSVSMAEQYAVLDPAEQSALVSAQRPIVLARRRRGDGPQLADGVAPGMDTWGLLMAPSALHALLIADVGTPLVLTSCNRTGAPLALTPDQVAEFATDVDYVVHHDQPIRARVDDSVVRMVADRITPVRRGRGYAPLTMRLPRPLTVPTLAVGAHMKNAFALGLGARCVLSQYVGDLDHPAALDVFHEEIARYEALHGVRPRRIVHDLHPDYASTHYARERGKRERLELVAVQHHHAHFLACLAEHDHIGPAVGIVCDGTGYGLDGAIWGGEVFVLAGVGDRRDAGIERVAHLSYVGMPGRSRAIVEPWRMAVAHAAAAGIEPTSLARLSMGEQARDPSAVLELLRTRTHAPPTSSTGRLFDAVAALLGVAPTRVEYDGQAAIELESLARSAADVEPWCNDCSRVSDPILDPGFIVRRVCLDVRSGVDRACTARRFHGTLAQMFAASAIYHARAHGIRHVALSGGALTNDLFATALANELAASELEVLCHHHIPANDGGIAVGQLAAVS